MTAPKGRARSITRYGTPVLHQPCAPVTAFDDALRQLVADMFASMYAARGVGLAANQIGVDARIFVYDCPDAADQPHVGHVINPVLVPPALPVAQVTDHEGCLSVPGQSAPLARPGLAQVTGFDVNGAPVTVTGTGTLARCLVHEFEHLAGIVYVDHLSDRARNRVLAGIGAT